MMIGRQLSIIVLAFVFFISLIPSSSSIPFIVLHGIADKCSSKGVSQFTQLLNNWSGSKGHCISRKWSMGFLVYDTSGTDRNRLQKGEECERAQGWLQSQGNLIGRGVLESCDGGPPVKNFISLAGPHAGTASVPLCGSGIMCIIADNLIKLEIYSDYVQIKLAPSGYLKIPTTKLYIEDWIGLRTLDEAGKVRYLTLPGKHLGISQCDMKKYVVPYLEDKALTNTKIVESYKWASSIWTAVDELIGLSEDRPLLHK